VQGVFSVLLTIFKTNVATVDGTSQASNIVGISKAIEIVLFPVPAG
jgi:hypothetical protein